MSTPILRRLTAQDARPERNSALDSATLAQAGKIVQRVRTGGETALREYAARLDGLSAEQPLVHEREELQAALENTPAETRALLERTADRIRRFAEAQRACLRDLEFEIPGGTAGHTIQPLATAGCYAPGGRYPLISSMLMTVVTARAAGVERVWAASPNPAPLMLAAAAVAGADAVLTIGGAHAIAALAYGVGPAPVCDAIVGPGNRWVTAAKYIVAADTHIDMLAGPSELLVWADEDANPALVAADLLAQAEHDIDACPILVTTSATVTDAVERELAQQLDTLPTRETASAALGNGYAILAANEDEALRVCNEIAPEHLELHVRNADQLTPRIRNCGCLFIGSQSAEALGDYGAGPNHTLPTGSTARYASGLSVRDFVRQHTWLRVDSPAAAEELLVDAATLAQLEGLPAHARSAQMRQGTQA